MVIKTLLDYCASFHSFKTDKKKLQTGHVTQHHQAINKPPHHTPVGARPAQSCPTAIAPSVLVPRGKAGSCLCPAPSCQESSRSSFLLEAAQQSSRGMHSPLPGPAGKKPSEHWAEQGPLPRSSCRPERQFLVFLHWLCSAGRHVLLAACSPLLPLANPLAPIGCCPVVTSHPPMVFLLLCAVLSALHPTLSKAKGREGGWWSGRKRDKLMPIARSEKTVPYPAS